MCHLAEHQPRLGEFPLVVVPDFHKLTGEFRKALTDYVEKGGNILLLEEKCARLFEPILGVELEGGPALEDIQLTIKTAARPKSVTWVPDGGTLEWSWAGGRLIVTIPKLKIHGVVVID
jgi:hypothetical protein